MATNNEYKGERLSFFKIFSEKKYKLVVPIIQRDYAQGRTTDATSEVRSEFLDALYSYLDENRPNRDLDFVYGTLQSGSAGEPTHFIPLDGQQRLTTLFLLHWFLYQISRNDEVCNRFKTSLSCGEKSLFTYETRRSSSDFCDALMQSEIDMHRLLTVEDKDGNQQPSLSATLQNEPWFFRVWKNDPTIQSMLVMLDAIYCKFRNRAEFFERLLDEENPIITFIFMDLREYKLTDDLYIKMNSRGKPLSKFENFKAKFEQYLKRFDERDSEAATRGAEPGKCRAFKLCFNQTEQDATLRQYYSYNVDTKWTTMLWQYCKNGKQEKLDSYIENLFRVVITNHYASVVRLSNKAKTDAAFDVLMGGDESLTFAKYEAAGVLTYDAVLAVIDTFDALYNGSHTIVRRVSPRYTAYYDEEAIFAKAIDNRLTRPERMQFFAYVQYIIRHGDRPEGLDDWMRVICNLTHPDNTITDGNDDLARGIRSIEKLLPYAPCIIDHLKGVTAVSGFSKHQSAEECIKAHLIYNKEWRALIEEAEMHPYFNGQIGFLLEFAGIREYYDKHHNLDWSADDNETYKLAFIRNSTIARHIFHLDDNGRRSNDTRYCFERAVLAHGDYLLQWKYGYYNLLSTETVKNNVKRDLSWRRMLRLDDDEEMSTGKALVKATFDDIADTNDVTGSLEQLCVPQTEDEWRNILISCPQMFEECKKGFMFFGDKEVFLLNEWYLNHYHKELFTYNLWLKKFGSDKVEFGGLTKEYAEQKSADWSPYIIIDGFEYKGIKYLIEINAILNNDYSLAHFQLSFSFDNKTNTQYPAKVLSILENLNFKPCDNDDYGYVWNSKSGTSILSRTKALVAALNELNAK